MCGNETSNRTILDAWRKQGVDLVDPTAFHYMAALQRRMADHQGDPRRVLESKLSALIKTYADNLEQAASRAADVNGPAIPARGALGGLVDDMAMRAAPRDGTPAAGAIAAHSDFPEMPALDDFRKLWASVRSDSQMRRSLTHSSTNAGPLNSSSLVHRSLTLMRELSPGYLQQFLSYVDALSWLERMNGSGALAAPGAPPSGNHGTRARNKPRKRRE